MSTFKTYASDEVFEATGELFVSAIDYASGGHDIRYDLYLAKDQSVELVFKEEPTVQLETGMRVSVSGERVESVTGTIIFVSSIRIIPVSAFSTQALVSGERKAILIVVNFSSVPSGSPEVECSNESLTQTMWTGTRNVDSYYRENSLGQVSFPPDTDGNGSPDIFEVTIPTDAGTGCQYGTWSSAANSVLTTQGVDLTLYQHRIYVFPSSAPCTWAGLGSIGCGAFFCSAWIRNCGLADAFAHELGHNLRVNHARLEGASSPNDLEYGDISSIMGYAAIGWRHFNAPNKAFLGWIPPERILTTTNGTFDLALSELLPSSVSPAPSTDYQIIRVPIASTPLDTSDYFYLSFRTGDGLHNRDLRSEYRQRLNIHRYRDGSSYTALTKLLSDGEIFDDANGIKIQLLSHTVTSGTVKIEAPETPTPTPTITLTPTPTITLTPTPTVSPSPSPTQTANPQASPTPTATLFALSGRVSLVVKNLPDIRKSGVPLTVIARNLVTKTRSKLTVDKQRRFSVMLEAGDYRVKVVSNKRKAFAVRSKRVKVNLPLVAELTLKATVAAAE